MIPGIIASSFPSSLDLLNLPGETVLANYRADTYTAGSWPDRSVNGHDLSQGTLANQPLSVADGGTDFNNQPVVRFDGSNDYLQSSASFVQAQPVTILAVAKNTLFNTFFKGLIDGRTDTSSAVRSAILWNSSEIISFLAGTSTIAGTAGSNTPLAIEAFFSGASSFMRVNGPIDASGNVGTGGILNGITVGASAALNSYLGGDIAELAIVDGQLNINARAYFADYVLERYNF